MIIVFIVAGGIGMSIVFIAGFWAGKHTERARQKRIYFDIETVLNKHPWISTGTAPTAPEVPSKPLLKETEGQWKKA